VSEAPAGAFRGDPAIKEDLLARLHHHAKNGTLMFGATHWDGRGGSPLGVSIQGDDRAEYAERFGYPLALAGLLDPLMALAATDAAVGHSLRWVSCVEPGADLSSVLIRIVDGLLREMGVDRLAAPYHSALLDLYRREASGDPPGRRGWSELRAAIERSEAAEEPGSDARAALAACATACWPLRTSMSVLSTLVAAWVQDATRTSDPAFSDTVQAQAHAMLDEIRRETQAQRDAGEVVNIPALFRSRAPDLAAAFEARLKQNNARYAERAHRAPGFVLDLIAAHAA